MGAWSQFQLVLNAKDLEFEEGQESLHDSIFVSGEWFGMVNQGRNPSDGKTMTDPRTNRMEPKDGIEPPTG